MNDQLKQTTIAEERELQDACNVVMDIANRITATHNASLPEGQRLDDPWAIKASALCLVVQTVFMVDQIGSENAIHPITREQCLALYTGLGAGVGHCIGAMLDPGPQLIAQLTLFAGIERGVRERRTLEKGLKGRPDNGRP